MARVYLGLGSNMDAESNLALAIGELRRRYGELDLSPVYRSRALGFDGDDFLNMVVGLDTDDEPLAIQAQVGLIHDAAGRVRGGARFSSRPLDIDLLLYDDRVVRDPELRLPRPDILEYSFVLRPLAELAPRLMHPETGRSMADHWREFDAASHPLAPVTVIL